MATSDPIIPSVRLTSKTAQEIRNDLVSRIPTITDRWTDFNDADLGMILLTSLAGMLETAIFELNFRAGETTRTHVRLRPDGVRLFSLLGFFFHRKVAARTTIKISLASPAARSVRIPSYLEDDYLEVSTSGSKRTYFSPEKTVVIPVGSTQASVTALQGRRGQEIFTATSSPDQVFTLSGTAIAEGTVAVLVEGSFWQIVEHFVESGPTSRHVQVVTDEYGVVRVLFGNGIFGSIPNGQVKVIYLETLGKQGNLVGKTRVTSLSRQLTDGDGNSVTATVTNTEDATGGDDEQTLWSAKKRVSRVYSAQQRAVVAEDIVGKAEAFPGIRQAAALSIEDVGPESFLIDYYEIRVPVIPTEGVRPSMALKKGLQDYLEKIKTVPDAIYVIDPEYVPVTVLADVVIRKGYDSSVVHASVVEAIESFFQIADSPSQELLLGGEVEGMQFGTDVSFSRLLATIQLVDGVYSVSKLTPSTDIVVDPFEIAILGDGSPVVNIVGTA